VIKTVTYTAHKRLKDVATRWVLTAVKNIKMRLRSGLCSLQRSPDLLARFGKGKGLGKEKG